MLKNSKLHAGRRCWGTRALSSAAAVLCGLLVAGLGGPWVNGRGRAQAADQPVEQAPAASEDPSAIDLTYVAADAALVKVIRPAAMSGRPGIDVFRKPVDLALKLLAGLEIGLDKLDQVTWTVLAPPGPADAGEPAPIERLVMILQAGEPHDFAGFINRWIFAAEKKEFQGRTYFVGRSAGRPAAYFRPNERTAILGSEEAVRRMIAAPGGRRPKFLAPETWAEFKDDHLLVAGQSHAVQSILTSPEFVLPRTLVAPWSPLWMETTSFAYGYRFEDRFCEHAVAFGKDEQGALKVEETIRALMTLRRNVADGLREPSEGVPPLLRSLQAMAVDVASDLASNAQLERSGTVVRVKTWTDASILVGNRAERDSAGPGQRSRGRKSPDESSGEPAS